MGQLTAKHVANYFLSLSSPELGESITNLKLQKLCYYAQGFHLALYDKPLFNEKIEAWVHGPVVEELYHEYKEHGSNGIPVPENINFSIYSKDVKKLLNDVWNVYGQFSGWKLRNLTHEEAPWKETFESGRFEIKHDLMKKFFKTQLN